MPGIPSAVVLSGGAPGSFPHSVPAERHPAVIRRVRYAFPYGTAQHSVLDALLESRTGGVLNRCRRRARPGPGRPGD
jgi:hypothetical protein